MKRSMLLAVTVSLVTGRMLLSAAAEADGTTGNSPWSRLFRAVQPDAAQTKDVHIVNRKPKGIVAGKRSEHEEITRVLSHSAAEEELGELRSFTLLAWCVKVTATRLPPTLRKEALDLAEWGNGDGFSLSVLSSSHGYGGRFENWQYDSWVRQSGLPVTASFDKAPTEADIVAFVQQTNFGNNEMVPDRVVATIFLYETDMPLLRKAMVAGIGDDEKWRRYDRACWMSAYPDPTQRQ
ncbi:MAG: hypothetical protein RBS80_00940 [Thermoguttaceae bacterium]|jgi:hypothetical protein|nr:hypothetical protein [Thermoguttaceae bacterium]